MLQAETLFHNNDLITLKTLADLIAFLTKIIPETSDNSLVLFTFTFSRYEGP
jgi:hypothetical protein